MRAPSAVLSSLSTLSALAVLAFSAGAAASPTFPPAIQTKLGLSNEPSCAICHEGGRGASGTVTTTFGRAMLARGLKVGNVASLSAALDQVAADGLDSDNDGVKDIDELKAGKDPNGNTGIAANAPPVEYGCGGATVARTRDDRTAPLAFAMFGLALVLRRRRRLLLPLVVAGAATFAACNPYDVAYVSAEVCQSGKLWTGGNEESELMNPGQPCITCHSKGEGPTFTVAGTLFGSSDEKDLCGGSNAGGAVVYIQDSAGKTLKLVPNEMGNFFSKLPISGDYKAWVQTADGKTRAMSAKQSIRDCNTCHTQTGSGGAPGRIVLP